MPVTTRSMTKKIQAASIVASFKELDEDITEDYFDPEVLKMLRGRIDKIKTRFENKENYEDILKDLEILGEDAGEYI